MQVAQQIVDSLTTLKEEANRLEKLAKDTDIYADALMVRSIIDGMANQMGDILENMPDLPTQATSRPKSINDFQIGDRVRLVSINMRPMYLRGAEGVVEKLGTKKVKVKLDTHASYKRFSGVVTACPVSILEKIG